MIIKPLNNIVLAQLMDQQKEDSVIELPDKSSTGFIQLKVLEAGSLVEGVKIGDKVYANDRLEMVDHKDKVGFINSKDILAVIKEE